MNPHASIRAREPLECPLSMKKRAIALVLCATGVRIAAADETDSSPPLREVVITATRVEADPFNIPAAHWRGHRSFHL